MDLAVFDSSSHLLYISAIIGALIIMTQSMMTVLWSVGKTAKYLVTTNQKYLVLQFKLRIPFT